MKNLAIILICSMLMCPSALATQISCVEGSKRVADIGTVFVCDKSKPALPNAYRDQNGVLWSVILEADIKPKLMNVFEADAYCKSAGAKLPTTTDLRRLQAVLGSPRWSDECEYKRRCYSPYLAYPSKVEVIEGLSSSTIWSSTRWMSSQNFYIFDGEYGSIGGAVVAQYDRFPATLCMVAP